MQDELIPALPLPMPDARQFVVFMFPSRAGRMDSPGTKRNEVVTMENNRTNSTALTAVMMQDLRFDEENVATYACLPQTQRHTEHNTKKSRIIERAEQELSQRVSA